MTNDFKKGFFTGLGGLLGVLSIPVGIYLIYSLIKLLSTTNLLYPIEKLLRKEESLEYEYCLVSYTNSLIYGNKVESKVEEYDPTNIYERISAQYDKYRYLKVKQYLQDFMAVSSRDEVSELAKEIGLLEGFRLDSDLGIEFMIEHIKLNKRDRSPYKRDYSSVFCGEEPKEWKGE